MKPQLQRGGGAWSGCWPRGVLWADLSPYSLVSDRLPSVPLSSALALPTPLSAPSQLLLELEGTGMNTQLFHLNVWRKLPCGAGREEEL